MLSESSASQDTITIGPNGLDTGIAIKGTDTAKIRYLLYGSWNALYEINGVAYSVRRPITRHAMAFHDTVHDIKTRRYRTNDFGLVITIVQTTVDESKVALVGRTQNPAPEPKGKEFIFDAPSQSVDFNNGGLIVTFRSISASATSPALMLIVNNSYCILGVNESMTVGPYELISTLAFFGNPSQCMGRIEIAEHTSISTQKNTGWKQKPAMAGVFDLRGRDVSDIHGSVANQIPGVYIVRPPDGIDKHSLKIR